MNSVDPNVNPVTPSANPVGPGDLTQELSIPPIRQSLLTQLLPARNTKK
jgi:hypothetical protein